MIISLNKKILIFGILCLFLFPANPVWAISLSFNPFAQSVGAGASFEVDLVISGLENVDLGAFDVDISFDDSILQFKSYTLCNELGHLSWEADDWSLGDLGNGTVNINEVSWLWDLSSQSDSFTLARLFFTGLNTGTSDVTSGLMYSRVVLSDAFGLELVTDVESASVTIAPVPEPGTLMLFAAGIVGIVRFRKKRG